MFGIMFNSSSTDMSALYDGIADCVITSPPYGKVKDYSDDTNQLGNYEGDMAIDMLKNVFKECHRVLKDGGFCCVNIGEYRIGYYHYPFYAKFTLMMCDLGFKYFRNIVWDKGFRSFITAYPDDYSYINSTERIIVFQKNEFNSTDFNKRFKGGNLTEINSCVWRIEPYNKKEGEHIAIYPEELVRRLLVEFSPKEDGLIIEPFLGSGTTMKVSNEYFRNCIGFEISKEYAEGIYKKICPQQCNLFGNQNEFLWFEGSNLRYTNVREKEKLQKFQKYLRIMF